MLVQLLSRMLLCSAGLRVLLVLLLCCPEWMRLLSGSGSCVGGLETGACYR